jgi:ribosomal protein S21
MAKVTNKDRYGNTLTLEQMLKRFQKKVEKEEIMLDLRRKECFVPKGVKRKLKSERHRKLMRKLEKKANR